MTNTPNRLLILKGKTWQVKIGIPADIRHAFDGRTAWVQSTGTGDISAARARRNEIEYQVQKLFTAARMGSVEALGDQGASLRQAWKDATTTSEEGEFGHRDLISEIALETAERMTPKDREVFEAGWLGLEDVNKHVPAWLREARLSAGTTKEWTRLTDRLNLWCIKEGVKLSMVTRKVAGRYTAEVLAPMNPATARKHLSCLKTYWGYMLRRGLVDDPAGNPWRDQLEPQRAKGGDKEAMETERALTKAECRTLVNGGGCGVYRADVLAELSLFGALTGLRLSEIMRLTVETCAGGMIDLNKAKTKSGVRTFPIHSGLAHLIEERTRGKAETDLLFPEWSDTDDVVKSASKAFKTYREKLGIDDKRADRRRSLVNFHSLRRTFVTLAHQAGQSEDIVASIVGHSTGKRKTQTFCGYSAGPSIEQKRVCVESVQIKIK